VETQARVSQVLRRVAQEHFQSNAPQPPPQPAQLQAQASAE
jgi:hypothetical protein